MLLVKNKREHVPLERLAEERARYTTRKRKDERADLSCLRNLRVCAGIKSVMKVEQPAE